MRKRCLRSVLCVTLAALTMLSAGCGKSESGGRFTWIDSNLPDCADLVSEARLEDDFAAAANAEWIISQTYDPVYENGTFSETNVIVDKNKRALLDDDSVTDKNLELVRTFDSLYSDWDHRDELGAEPVRKYLKRIDSISTLKDAEDYMLDNDGNPFALMPFTLGTTKSDSKKDHLCLLVTQPSYSFGSSLKYSADASVVEIKKTAVLNKVSHVLTKLGYTDDDIQKIVDDCVDFETKLAAINPKQDYDTADVIGKEEFISEVSSIDLGRILEHYNLGDTVNYTGDFKYLKALDGIFTDDNLEGIKAYFTVQLISNSVLLLDTDNFDYSQTQNLNEENPFAEVDVSYKDRYLFKTIQTSPLSAAMDQAYLDRYYNQDVYDDIYHILDELKDKYKEIINEKDWYSKKSRENIVEKLDSIIFNVIQPSNEADYKDLKLDSYEEGGTLIDAYAGLNRFKIMHYGELTTMDYERGFWDIYDNRMSTTKVGDLYDPFNNRIIVMIGILNGDIYSYDMPDEQKLAAIGTVLGHEMSHAFDSDGVYYDKNGDYNCILEGARDIVRFNKKANKVTEYFTGITPFEGAQSYTSDNILSAEAIADMGGMKCVLKIASDRNDFDYDLFFKGYASLWKRFTPKGEQYECVLTDNHPLAYLRINVTVQQFDEFYETYNIQPGDNMYLAPKERIAIW